MMQKLKVLDLFSGIGGFSLGLERTGGFETVAFCEIDSFCQKILKKHWPSVPIYQDVKALNYEGTVDVICGGFPCQDISTLGEGEGLEGERSGLWYEFKRIIDEVGAPWVIIENVTALRGNGLVAVLQNLCEIGYDAEWHCIPASHLGAPHQRDRIWIISYPNSKRCDTRGKRTGREEGSNIDWSRKKPIMAHPNQKHVQRIKSGIFDKKKRKEQRERQAGSQVAVLGGFWSVEPDVGRVAHGVPDRSHRLKGLGNAVVPQIPEMIGNAILERIS